MKTCDGCGNAYDKTFDVVTSERTYTFDCFECAIHKVAPQCHACGCTVLGHGVEAKGVIYCCAHCADRSGAHGAVDRVA